MNEIQQLEDEIKNGPTWTVIGFRLRSGERYCDWYYANNAALAEEFATYDAKHDSHGPIAVCAVIEGKHKPQDTHTFLDPKATNPAEMWEKYRSWDLGGKR